MKPMFSAFLLFSALFFCANVMAKDARLDVLDAMETELSRAKESLKLPGFEAPYFIAYQLKTVESRSLRVKYGAVYQDTAHTMGDLNVEVRVGSYDFDNTGTAQDIFSFSMAPGQPTPDDAPIDRNLEALKTSLWLLTDAKYKEALSDYQQKKGKAVYQKPDDTASFSRETPSKDVGPAAAFSFDGKVWRERLLKLSGLLASQPEILQSQIGLRAEKITRYYVNSEGGRIVDERVLFSLAVDAEARADDDMLLPGNRSFYAPSEDRLPSYAELEKQVKSLIGELASLRKAPVLDPYSGPAILSPQATAVLFHEAVGHRLEGHRQNNEEEGRTYKGQVGQSILPDFLDLVDDPSLAEWQGTPLNGFYKFDDEGVPGQRVTLVEGGVLKNFLMSRKPIQGFAQSNGHGRGSNNRPPVSRMGNTMLLSKKAVPYAELKTRLIELVKAQGKPYGLIIEDMEGGQTNTSSYGYQAYKGLPRVVKRIFPDGREELVRGVEMVGTPIASINKILATGDKTEVYNGYCGAESGYVPVSAIAPAILLNELELQRQKEEKGRPPVLKSPYSGK